MKNIAYKNHDDDLKQIINLIFENKSQIILYNSHEGYGNTAFISRVQYILYKTPTLQLFYAELSSLNTNPLHVTTKNIISKEGEIYHQLQLFTDEENGLYETPISFSDIIKDLTHSDTLASLFNEKASIPIYSGFYQDRLKENFFHLINCISKEKRIIYFIDNIQYMDNESIYELKALLNNTNVTLILFKSGNGDSFDKFYYEMVYNVSFYELDFPEPDIIYVQKLGTLYNKNISKKEADLLLYKSEKNIRKLLFYMRKPNTNISINEYEQQILKIIYLYNDTLCISTLLKICSYGPYQNIFTKTIITKCIKKLEEENYIQSITTVAEQKKIYTLSKKYLPQIDIADKVVINRSLLSFYYSETNLDYQHLNQAWQISNYLKDNDKKTHFSYIILKIALKRGYKVNHDIIAYAKNINESHMQILVATFLFCNANYIQAKNIFESLPSPYNRSISVMYAITLNRCREHKIAEKNLNDLINTSQNIDEKAILVTFLISNHVHSGKLRDAQNTFKAYNEKLQKSIKYAYFLRNSATVYETENAHSLRKKAASIFKKNNDMFGYYSTIINMSSYLFNYTDSNDAISQVLMAFEGLQQYNASQIHLAANNLGVGYILSNNYLQASKYLELAIENAQTIMPIGYATINLSGLYMKMHDYENAYNCIYKIYDDVVSTNIPRLKARFYLHVAVVEYIKNNFLQAINACKSASKYCNSIAGNKVNEIIKLLNERMSHKLQYSDEIWDKIYIPCYLEYWTINSVDILNDNFLSL